MLDFLSLVVTLGLLVQAAIGLSYVISSIWEKERRATLFAAVQFIGMLGLDTQILLHHWCMFF